MSPILPCLLCRVEGSGGGGRGHFIHLAIHCTTTWRFALKGLRTITQLKTSREPRATMTHHVFGVNCRKRKVTSNKFCVSINSGNSTFTRHTLFFLFSKSSVRRTALVSSEPSWACVQRFPSFPREPILSRRTPASRADSPPSAVSHWRSTESPPRIPSCC